MPTTDTGTPSADSITKALRDIWAKTLKVDDLGMDEDFFDLGGDSLKAMLILAHVRDRFGVELGVREFFRALTVQKMAEVVAPALNEVEGESIASAPRTGLLPLSSYQQRVFDFFKQSPRSRAYLSFGAYTLRGPLDAGALIRSLQELVRRHEILRTSYRSSDHDGDVQEIHDPSAFRVPLTNLVADPGAEARLPKLHAEAAAPFDLYTELPIRASIARLDRDHHVLFLTRHHIGYDAISNGLLWRELNLLYEGFSQGRRPELPQLPIQYADFATWQRKKLAALANYDSQIGFWSSQLNGLRKLHFYEPKPGGHNDGAGPHQIAAEIDENTTEALRRFAAGNHTTLFAVLLTLYKMTVHEYTIETELAVAVNADRRTHPALVGLIGFFNDLMMIRTSLADDPPFDAYAARVQDAVNASMSNHDVPFDEMKHVLKQKGIHFNVRLMFQYLELPESAGPSFDGIEVTRYSPSAAPLDPLPRAGNDAASRASVAGSVKDPAARDRPPVGKVLLLGFQPDGAGLHGWWRYDPRKYSTGLVDAMNRFLVRLMKHALHDPSRPISEIMAQAREDIR